MWLSRMNMPAAAAAMALLAACSGTSPTETTGDELTVEELQALFAEAGLLGGEVPLPGVPGTLNASGGTAASEPVDVAVSTSAACPVAGNISVNGAIEGDIDATNGQGSLTADWTVDYDNCQVETDAGVFTINGDPNLHTTGSYTLTETTLDAEFALVGGFSFVLSDGRAGTCGIDVQQTLTATFGGTNSSFDGSISGTVCDRAADQVVD